MSKFKICDNFPFLRLYDPKKPDVTRNKMDFKLKIQ